MIKKINLVPVLSFATLLYVCACGCCLIKPSEEHVVINSNPDGAQFKIYRKSQYPRKVMVSGETPSTVKLPPLDSSYGEKYVVAFDKIGYETDVAEIPSSFSVGFWFDTVLILPILTDLIVNTGFEAPAYYRSLNNLTYSLNPSKEYVVDVDSFPSEAEFKISKEGVVLASGITPASVVLNVNNLMDLYATFHKSGFISVYNSKVMEDGVSVELQPNLNTEIGRRAVSLKDAYLMKSWSLDKENNKASFQVEIKNKNLVEEAADYITRNVLRTCRREYVHAYPDVNPANIRFSPVSELKGTLLNIEVSIYVVRSFGHSYNRETRKGKMVLDISRKNYEETYKWAIKNIGIISSNKTLAVTHGNEFPTGAQFKILNETTTPDGFLEIEFQVLQ